MATISRLPKNMRHASIPYLRYIGEACEYTIFKVYGASIPYLMNEACEYTIFKVLAYMGWLRLVGSLKT